MNLLITGANRGLGCELTAEALERGHRVIAGVRYPEAGHDRLTALAAEYAGQLEVLQLDVTEEGSIARLAEQLSEAGRTLGGIVNNAAVLLARNTQIEELDMEDMERTIDINLYGPMRVVKHFLPLLTEPQAVIANISSEAGSLTNAYPGDYPYGISKAALNMFTQQLQSYLKERDVEVLSIHPGWMKTDMGGDKAPGDPRQSARGILDLIERKVVPEGRLRFFDQTGKPMTI
ncbi:SDR family oxidoreductase [Paenibacillus daejeonensis]|uniref:SDR family oxidoreductase n=1 Tax=Paenibacillus daejeonensis TaxID=135193 RepID=UPI00035FA2C8|nr:SDR family oxidoreductase [Paenibacillus daejeonensis]